MPIILIIVGAATLFGIGSYFLRPSNVPLPEPVVEGTGFTSTTTAKIETDSIAVIRTEPKLVATTTTVTPVTPTKLSVTPEQPPAPLPIPTPTPVPNITPKPAVATKFKAGSYTVSSNYVAPGRTTHTVDLTLTIENDEVIATNVVYGGDYSETSEQYQKRFSSTYKSAVISKQLDSISLSRVGGASLTSGAFNKALANIVEKART